MQNIKYENGRLYLLDQTLLPNEEKYIEPKTKEDYYYAIKKLQVRGAPAIGIFAAYAMALIDGDKKELKEYLDSSRPTAVNLSWATTRMLKAYNDGKDLISEAIAIHNEDIAMCKKISEYGLSLLNNGDGILTHCNAGALATSEYGTGLGPLLLGKEKGYNFKVFCDETRPLLQGARLTAYELTKAGIDTTVICDNMASLVMKQGKINAVLVGTDRIAANGDIANKIGTSGVAILANLLITGVPIGGGTISEMLIITMMGFPVAALPILTMVATIIDAPATMLNVVGDTVSSMMVTRIVDGKGWIKEDKEEIKEKVNI